MVFIHENMRFLMDCASAALEQSSEGSIPEQKAIGRRQMVVVVIGMGDAALRRPKPSLENGRAVPTQRPRLALPARHPRERDVLALGGPILYGREFDQAACGPTNTEP